MKTLNLITVLMLAFAAPSLAGEKAGSVASSQMEYIKLMTPIDYLQLESQEVETDHSSQMTQMVLRKLACGAKNPDVLERLQHETQDISLARPIWYMASLVKKQLEKNHDSKSASALQSR